MVFFLNLQETNLNVNFMMLSLAPHLLLALDYFYFYRDLLVQTYDMTFIITTVYIQRRAEWTPTFLKVTGKGVVGVGRRGRSQRLGRIV